MYGALARMAAAALPLETKRQVQYRQLDAKSLIGPASSPNMPFQWTVNPYRGCEFACKYCYARYTHEFMELRESEQFENEIFAKRFDEAVFRRDLARIPRQQVIAIGTATDPYQPAERRYRVTRRMLEVLAGERGRHLGITTKSDLITRDIDLLEQIASRNHLHVLMTITTIESALARLLEPRAPRPDLRLRAIRCLSKVGIHVTVLHSPVMPGINDTQESIDAVAAEAAAAGARSFSGRVLFLQPCAARVFLPFVEQQFPELAARYHAVFDRSAFMRGPYVETIARRVEAARERSGLASRPIDYKPELWAGDPQLDLFPALAAETPPGQSSAFRMVP
jgi:DNA repair photolyase